MIKAHHRNKTRQMPSRLTQRSFAQHPHAGVQRQGLIELTGGDFRRWKSSAISDIRKGAVPHKCIFFLRGSMQQLLNAGRCLRSQMRANDSTVV